MGARNKQGSTRKDELLSAQRQLGIVPKELEEEPELSPLFHECWLWFLRLNNKRQSGMGVSPISFLDMQAFFYLLQYNPEQWEIEMIERFDNIALEHFAKQQEKEQQLRDAKNKK